MARSRHETPTLPALFAVVLPGLEEVAAEEIEKRLGGEVKKTSRGVVVFRLEAIDRRVLSLRTTEDVFLLAWGSDSLSYRAADLAEIEKWTARKPDWPELLRLHHTIRPRPRGKPTYRLVAQMEGMHGYRRTDAGKAMGRGLGGVFPDSWKPAEENASIEVWLCIDGAVAVCGVRLSDRTMRHRQYKDEHRPASLRPTVAAAMCWIAGARAGEALLDPMCGAGTILAEAWEMGKGQVRVLGGDIERGAVRDAGQNLMRLGEIGLARWDARHLPLEPRSIDHVVSNPPFGKQLASPEEVVPLYRAMVREYDRVLKPGGQAVLLTADADALREACEAVGWKGKRRLRVLVLGQMATLGVWRKPA
ncbi:MAG: methyltransferase domain-containing protein [Gemmataceae bacterium]|nr:methyltransferase domain-containing protein [Gemmataceae bacterium]